MTQVLSASDVVNPESGLTFREENTQKSHVIPLFALVEIMSNPDSPSPNDGLRLFVQKLGRDCDQTPLYWLTHNYKMVGREFDVRKIVDEDDRIAAVLNGGCTIGGYSEERLVVVRSAEEVIASIEAQGWFVRDGKFCRE